MTDNFFTNILKDNNVVLAPMAGITNASYRYFYKDFNIALYYTEMVSVMGLVYDNEQTLKYLPLDKKYSVRPIGVQLFGYDEESFVKAIKIMESIDNGEYYDFIDINLGCSVPKVSRSGSGASLLKDLSKLKTIMTAIVKTSKKPVSAKIRLGWDSNDVHKIIKILEESGVQMIALHPRYAKQLFQGKPHWDLVKNIQETTSVPIVVSGDIYTLDDAINALTITKAMGVMVGRGGIGNPLLAKNIHEHYHNLPITEFSFKNQCVFAYEYTEFVHEIEPDRAYGSYKSVLPKFYFGVANVKQIRKEIVLAESVDQIRDTVKILKNNVVNDT